MNYLPVAICLTSVAILLAAEWSGLAWLKALAKSLASAAFVWFALASGALLSWYGHLVLVALVLCLVGDLFLLATRRGALFQAGIAAFLLGHLVFALAFLQLPHTTGGIALGALVMLAFAAATLRWLGPHLPGPFVWPVRAYVAAIWAMVSLAIAASVGAASPLIGLAAAGFALSDVSVARDRFVAPGFGNRLWGLPLYYLCQLLLAGSVATAL